MLNNKFLSKIEYLGQKLDYFHTIIMSQKPQKKIENQIKQIQDHRNRFINLNSVFLKTETSTPSSASTRAAIEVGSRKTDKNKWNIAISNHDININNFSGHIL